jgi:hypothetical protein
VDQKRKRVRKEDPNGKADEQEVSRLSTFEPSTSNGQSIIRLLYVRMFNNLREVKHFSDFSVR